jgi:lysophospholipase L1-like esterase
MESESRVIRGLPVLLCLVACGKEVPGDDMGVGPGSSGVAGVAGVAGAYGGASAGSAGAAGRAGAPNSGGVTSEGGSGGSAERGGSGNLGGASGASSGGASGSGSGAGGESGEGPGGLPSFRMVVIGSSTAAGEGASSPSRGWVGLLSSSLENMVTTEWSSRNLAQGGYTTSELLPGSGANGNIDDSLELDPNLVVVALAGSNDLSAGTSESVFLSRLTTLRDTARAAGVPVFFVSTAPKDLSTSERQALRDWAEAMETSFGSCWVPGRADEYSPCFIDIFEPLANSSLGVEATYSAGDGIHLNDAGHAVIFEAARDVVSAYVCAMTACR